MISLQKGNKITTRTTNRCAAWREGDREVHSDRSRDPRRWLWSDATAFCPDRQGNDQV